ncbi:MAG: PQQ-binding-like beta-propeller repeat protein [Pirellulales bacterium]
MQRVLSLLIVAGLVAVAGCQDKQGNTAHKSPEKPKGTSAKSDTDPPPGGQAADELSPADKKGNASVNGQPGDNEEPSRNPEPADNSKPSPNDQPADNSKPSPNDEPNANGATDTAAAESDLPEPKLSLEITGTTTAAEAQKIANAPNRPDDWSQWGGSSTRNNVVATKVPTEWEIGDFDIDTGDWKKETAKNIKWGAKLGSETYGNAVVANGKVFIGTNNGAEYLKRYPADVDLGVLLCFDEKDGKFLWQDSNEKLHTGRVHDWPLLGVCSSPLVERDRVYYVSNRGELKCLDTEGFGDSENDGAITNEKEQALKNTPDGEWDEQHEADVVWVLDMMRALGVSQHNMANSSVTVSGDYLFLLTSNGVDDAHINLPSPYAPSFIAVDKRNGKVLWTDNTPGVNVLHGQWSSPAYAVIDDVPQVIFGGGDGWLYGFDARGENGKSKLLWKFDCNPKESKYKLTGADRNHIIGTPVIHENQVYIAVGEDPEHGEGVGHLWCVDPTKRGDISPELVFNTKDESKPIPHKRNQALVKEEGDFKRANPNSAAVWHYSSFDKNGDGKLQFEETMHRTMGSVAIKDDFLFIIDFQGLVHCVDVNTGKPFWTHDMLAASWASPLIAGEHVYISDEDGEVIVFKLGEEPERISEISMGNSVYSTPIVAGGVLYISNKNYLFAITDKTDE